MQSASNLIYVIALSGFSLNSFIRTNIQSCQAKSCRKGKISVVKAILQVDLGNLNNSFTVHTTGESSHAYNEHYDDMSPLWADVKYYPMWWGQESAMKDSKGHLQLVP